MGKQMKTIFAALAVSVSMANCYAAQTQREKMEAYDFIVSRAKTLCEVVRQNSSADGWSASLKVQGELSGLVKQVAKLGGEGAIGIENRKTEGALQKDLATLLTPEVTANEGTCRERFFDRLEKQLLEPPVSQRPSALDLAKQYEAQVEAQVERLMGHVRHTDKAEQQPCVVFRQKWSTIGIGRAIRNGMISSPVAPYQPAWPTRPSIVGIGAEAGEVQLSQRIIEAAASKRKLSESFASEGQDLGCLTGYR